MVNRFLRRLNMTPIAPLRRLLIGKDYGASCLTIPAGYISGQEAL
jgi:hypothetical protein